VTAVEIMELIMAHRREVITTTSTTTTQQMDVTAGSLHHQAWVALVKVPHLLHQERSATMATITIVLLQVMLHNRMEAINLEDRLLGMREITDVMPILMEEIKMETAMASMVAEEVDMICIKEEAISTVEGRLCEL